MDRFLIGTVGLLCLFVVGAWVAIAAHAVILNRRGQEISLWQRTCLFLLGLCPFLAMLGLVLTMAFVSDRYREMDWWTLILLCSACTFAIFSGYFVVAKRYRR